MKNFAFVMLVLLCLILGAVGSVLAYLLASRNAEIETLRAGEAEAKLIGAARPKATEEEKRLRERVKELEAELAAINSEESVPAAEGKGEKKENSPAAMMKNLAKMMEDPAMRDMMKSQQRIAIDGMFGEFFRQFDLSEEEEAAVRELLLDRQMVATTTGMKALDGGKTQAEREEVAKEMKKEMDAINKEIEATLGEEMYKDFKLFEDSQQERQLLTSYKDVLAKDGIPLEEEVEQQLMTTMYETRKGFKFSTDFGSETNPNPDALKNFSKKSADRYLDEYKVLQAQVYEQASAILTPAQLEAFRNSQEGYAKMQEMGMKMTIGVLGGSEE